jgi:hypothetical protein
MGISDRDLKKWGKRGYVTYDELNAVFPPDASGEDIESSMAILSEQNIECVEAKEDYIPKKSKSTNKKSKPGPNVTNPFTKKQRQLLGQWSRFAKEENLLEPHQRRYLYFGSKYDKWYDNLPSKLVETLNKLKEHLTEEGSQQAIILRATLNYGQILIQAKAGEDWAQELAGDYWHFGT